MLYIGFSTTSHKPFAKIICKKYKHCAPIKIQNGKGVLYQFVNMYKIVLIPINLKDLKILETFGWKFAKYNENITPEHAIKTKTITCVQFTKRVCGIKNITIQTPDALLKHIDKK